MTTTIIISICVLLLLAYVFDISSSKTKIPSVILLLTVGWLVRQGAIFFELNVPDLSSILPILGTVGLILIVLEGSLELELNRSKLGFIGKTVIISFLPMLLFCFGLAAVFQYFGNISFKDGLANAIPFGVISSAIAIPSVQNLISKDKEFITYESSLSDIFGVIFFNFITLNDNIGTPSVGHFIIELLIILLVTFVATIGLAFLLSKIKHHVKFLPIILIIVLIYAVSKIYHLPGLIFILLFGLFIGNLDELKNYEFIQKLQPQNLNKEVHKFKELTSETAFLIRSLFFLLFGYLIETHELINQETIVWAVAITLSIFVLRFIFLRLFNQNIKPLLFIAPRGLITILLFLSIPINQVTSLANKSLILQVIILTALFMMIGLMSNKTKTLEKTVEADI
jgi:potassium/hydrogen antiporter